LSCRISYKILDYVEGLFNQNCYLADISSKPEEEVSVHRVESAVERESREILMVSNFKAADIKQ